MLPPTMEWALLWLGLAIVVGVAANARGRSGPAWLLLAVIISPLLAGLLVLALPRPGPLHKEEITVVQQRDPVSVAILGHRKVTPELLDLIAQRSTQNLKPLDVVTLLRDGKRVYTENSYFVRDDLPPVGAADAYPGAISRHRVEVTESALSQSQPVFKPDAVLKGFPYRLLEDGTVDAMMTGGLVRFRDMEQFRAAAEGRDEVQNVQVKAPLDPNNPDLFSKVERHFGRRVAFLLDGSVFGDTDSGPRTFNSFEEWRRFVGE